MAEEGLKIKVGADVQEAVTSLNTLNASLNKTTQTAANVGTAGMNQLTKGTKEANFALVNFGRVASDAPFGLIGIANNIDPLVQSFVSLKRETGSGKAALQALASSLAGGGGLILGISLLTSALQFLQLGFSRWGASSKKAKEDTDKLKQANESLIETVSKQRLEFETLVKVAKDVNQTEVARAQALKRLNEILPDTIGKLNQQNIATKEGEEAIRRYIDAITAKATAELLSGRIAANNVQIFDLQQKSLKEIADLNKDIERNTKLRKSLEGSGRLEQEAITQRKIGNAQKDIVSIQKQTQIEIDKITKLNETLSKEYEKQIPVVNTLNDKKVKGANKEQTLQDKINELLSDYKNTLKSISYEEQITGLNQSNQRLQTNLDFLKRAADLVGFTGDAYKQINKDTQAFANAAANQKILELINNYKAAYSELDIKQSITGQDQLNARINLTVDALFELKKAGKDNTEQYTELQNTLSNLKAEVGLREIRKRTEEITKVWERFQLQAQKLDFNKTKQPLDTLKSKIDLIGNAIQDLKAKGLTDNDLGIQVLGAQLNGLLDQFKKLQAQKELFDSLRSAIEGGLTNAFSSVFEALLEGEDVFKSLGNSIKRLVVDLVKLVIQMTVVRAIANAIVPGAGGQVAGQAAGMFLRGDTLRGLTFGR